MAKLVPYYLGDASEANRSPMVGHHGGMDKNIDKNQTYTLH
jgi:hypothetical protein